MIKKIIVAFSILLVAVAGVVAGSYWNKINSSTVKLNSEQFYAAEYKGYRQVDGDKTYIMFNLALQRPWSFTHLRELPKYSRYATIVVVLVDNQLSESFFSESKFGDEHATLTPATGSLKVDDEMLRDVSLTAPAFELQIEKIGIDELSNMNIKDLVETK